MEGLLPPLEKVVSNNPSMAPPPDGFCTHDSATSFRSNFHELLKAVGEFIRKRIVRVVVEAAVVPEAIQLLVDRFLPLTSAAQLRNGQIADLIGRKLSVPTVSSLYWGFVRDRLIERTSTTS